MEFMPKRFEKSIIIPMNPRGSYSGGSTRGSIIANKWFADRKGAVVISCDQGRKDGKYPDISLGYFYDSESHLVTHRFNIEKMTNYTGLSTNDVEVYLPGWRLDLYKEGPRDRQIWLKIRDIFELEKPEELSSFGRKRCQSYVYSDVQLDLPFKKEKTSPDDFIDDIIYRCAISRTDKLMEADLELILWACIVESGATHLDRQLSCDTDTEGKERIRLDIFFKTRRGEFVVIELKRGPADSEALDQIRRYMKKMEREYGVSGVKGVIMARKAEKKLSSALEGNADISFEPYRFAFSSKWVKKTFFQ